MPGLGNLIWGRGVWRANLASTVWLCGIVFDGSDSSLHMVAWWPGGFRDTTHEGPSSQLAFMRCSGSCQSSKQNRRVFLISTSKLLLQILYEETLHQKGRTAPRW